MAQLLENAWMGSALILAVAVLRRLLKGRLPPGAWLTLWAVCLARLLAPVSLGSPLSLYALGGRLSAAADSSVPAAPAPSAAGAAPSAAPGFVPPVLSGGDAFPAEAAQAASISPAHILPALYLIGAACMLLWLAVGYVRTRRAAACATVLPRSDPRCAGLPRSVRVAEGPVPGAPLTFGALRPVIILPPGLSGAPLDFVLAHEGVHARRRDNLWHYAVAAVQVLFWWDPAVWLMARLIRRDVELSCDRAALRRLGPDRRGDYARALLTFAIRGEGPAFSHTFGQKQAEERIIAIMKYKKMSVASLVLSLVLVGTTTAVFATTPMEPDIPDLPLPVVMMDEGEPAPPHGDLNKGVVDGVTPVGSSVEGVDESALDPSRSVSISTDFTVKVGASFIRSFNTGNLFVEDHNAFNVIVSDTNGRSYKVLVLNDQGWSFESDEYTRGCTVTISNAFSDQTFTVYILNTDTKELTGHVKISSFYNN